MDNLYEAEYYLYRKSCSGHDVWYKPLMLDYMLACSFDEAINILKNTDDFHEIKSLKVLTENFKPLLK